MAGLTTRNYSYSNVQRSADGSRVRSTGRSVVNTGNRIVVGNPGSGIGAVDPARIQAIIAAAKQQAGLRFNVPSNFAQPSLPQQGARPGVGLPQGREQVKALMQRMAAERGWTGAQWQALDRLEMKEAGYNPLAQNPSSTAFGLGQFLNSTWKAYGAQKTTDAAGQIKAMYDYIVKRYGNPQRALSFHLGHNWY